MPHGYVVVLKRGAWSYPPVQQMRALIRPKADYHQWLLSRSNSFLKILSMLPATLKNQPVPAGFTAPPVDAAQSPYGVTQVEIRLSLGPDYDLRIRYDHDQTNLTTIGVGIYW